MRILRAVAVIGVPLAAAILLRSSARSRDVAAARSPARVEARASGPVAITAVRGDSPRAATYADARAPERAPPEPVRTDLSADELRASVEQRFQADAHDPAWAASSRHRAEQLLTHGLLPGSALRTLACKASICRAEVEQADLAAHQTFLQAALGGGGWDGPTMAALAPRGERDPVVTVVYLGRAADSLVDTVPVEALDMPASDEPITR